MNRDNFWKEFEETGSVEAYLRYRGKSTSGESVLPEDAVNANKDRRNYPKSTEYRG